MGRKTFAGFHRVIALLTLCFFNLSQLAVAAPGGSAPTSARRVTKSTMRVQEPKNSEIEEQLTTALGKQPIPSGATSAAGAEEQTATRLGEQMVQQWLTGQGYPHQVLEQEFRTFVRGSQLSDPVADAAMIVQGYSLDEPLSLSPVDGGPAIRYWRRAGAEETTPHGLRGAVAGLKARLGRGKGTTAPATAAAPTPPPAIPVATEAISLIEDPKGVALNQAVAVLTPQLAGAARLNIKMPVISRVGDRTSWSGEWVTRSVARPTQKDLSRLMSELTKNVHAAPALSESLLTVRAYRVPSGRGSESSLWVLPATDLIIGEQIDRLAQVAQQRGVTVQGTPVTHDLLMAWLFGQPEIQPGLRGTLTIITDVFRTSPTGNDLAFLRALDRNVEAAALPLTAQLIAAGAEEVQNVLAASRQAGIFGVITPEDRAEETREQSEAAIVKAVALGVALAKAGGIPEIAYRVRPEHESKVGEIVRRLVTQLKAEGLRVPVAVGSVSDPTQVWAAREAGATIVVSPTFDKAIVVYAVGLGLVAIPGVRTVAEAQEAHAAGAQLLKVFPVNFEGLAKYESAIKAPMTSAELADYDRFVKIAESSDATLPEATPTAIRRHLGKKAPLQSFRLPTLKGAALLEAIRAALPTAEFVPSGGMTVADKTALAAQGVVAVALSVKDDQDVAKIAAAHVGAEKLKVASSDVTFVIVEDAPHNQLLLLDQLGLVLGDYIKAGTIDLQQVKIFTKATEAAQWVREHHVPFLAMFTDLNTDQGLGFEVADAVQAAKQPAVVFLLSSPGEETQVTKVNNYVTAGKFTQFLQKPVDLEALKQAVHAHLIPHFVAGLEATATIAPPSRSTPLMMDEALRAIPSTAHGSFRQVVATLRPILDDSFGFRLAGWSRAASGDIQVPGFLTLSIACPRPGGGNTIEPFYCFLGKDQRTILVVHESSPFFEGTTTTPAWLQQIPEGSLREAKRVTLTREEAEAKGITLRPETTRVDGLAFTVSTTTEFLKVPRPPQEDVWLTGPEGIKLLQGVLNEGEQGHLLMETDYPLLDGEQPFIPLFVKNSRFWTSLPHQGRPISDPGAPFLINSGDFFLVDTDGTIWLVEVSDVKTFRDHYRQIRVHATADRFLHAGLEQASVAAAAVDELDVVERAKRVVEDNHLMQKLEEELNGAPLIRQVRAILWELDPRGGTILPYPDGTQLQTLRAFLQAASRPRPVQQDTVLQEGDFLELHGLVVVRYRVMARSDAGEPARVRLASESGQTTGDTLRTPIARATLVRDYSYLPAAGAEETWVTTVRTAVKEALWQLGVTEQAPSLTLEQGKTVADALKNVNEVLSRIPPDREAVRTALQSANVAWGLHQQRDLPGKVNLQGLSGFLVKALDAVAAPVTRPVTPVGLEESDLRGRIEQLVRELAALDGEEAGLNGHRQANETLRQKSGATVLGDQRNHAEEALVTAHARLAETSSRKATLAADLAQLRLIEQHDGFHEGPYTPLEAYEAIKTSGAALLQIGSNSRRIDGFGEQGEQGELLPIEERAMFPVLVNLSQTVAARNIILVRHGDTLVAYRHSASGLEEVSDATINEAAELIRYLALDAIGHAGAGHPGGSLSEAEILATLFLSGIVRYDPTNPKWDGRTRFILSKGHAAPGWYALRALLGDPTITREDLKTLRRLDSRLQGHPDMTIDDSAEVSTGALGGGVASAEGMAIALKQQGNPASVVVVAGDGEIQSGKVHEVWDKAPTLGLDNFLVVVDWNEVQQERAVKEHVGYGPQDLADQLHSKGWEVQVVEAGPMGNNLEYIRSLQGAFAKVRADSARNGSPRVVIVHTIKGRGVSFAEGKTAYHGKALTKDEFAQAASEIAGRLGIATTDRPFDEVVGELEARVTQLTEQLKAARLTAQQIAEINRGVTASKAQAEAARPKPEVALPVYTAEQKVATREAFGETLAALMAQDRRIVPVDISDLSGSTGLKKTVPFGVFGKDPQGRFVELGIREASGGRVVAGLAAAGQIPVAATFERFGSLAADSILYMQQNHLPGVFAFTHSGPIGPASDGPSNASWEEPSMFAGAGITVLEPADATEAVELTQKAIALAQERREPIILRLHRSAWAAQLPAPTLQEEGFKVWGAPTAADLLLVTSGEVVPWALEAQQKASVKIAVVSASSPEAIARSEFFRGFLGRGKPVFVAYSGKAKILVDVVRSAALQSGWEFSQVPPIIVFKEPAQRALRTGSPEQMPAYYGLDAATLARDAAQIVEVTPPGAARGLVFKTGDSLPTGVQLAAGLEEVAPAVIDPSNLPKTSLMRLANLTNSEDPYGLVITTLDGFPAPAAGETWQQALVRTIEQRGAANMTTNQALIRQLVQSRQLDDRMAELATINADRPLDEAVFEIYNTLYREAAVEAARLFRNVQGNWPELGLPSRETRPETTNPMGIAEEAAAIHADYAAAGGAAGLTKVGNVAGLTKVGNVGDQEALGATAIQEFPELATLREKLAGVQAVGLATADRVNVNVTLVFALTHALDTVEAYVRGLTALRAALQRRDVLAQDIKGILSQIHSVNSLFVSRTDTAVDALIDDELAKTTDDATRETLHMLRGKTAVAQAQIAARIFERIFGEEDRPLEDPRGLLAGEHERIEALRREFSDLRASGANRQRLLIASSGVKNKDYDPLLYFLWLLGKVQNTLPEGTLNAASDWVATLSDEQLWRLKDYPTIRRGLPRLVQTEATKAQFRAAVLDPIAPMISADEVLVEVQRLVLGPRGTTLAQIGDGLRDKGRDLFIADEQATLQQIRENVESRRQTAGLEQAPAVGGIEGLEIDHGTLGYFAKSEKDALRVRLLAQLNAGIKTVIVGTGDLFPNVKYTVGGDRAGSDTVSIVSGHLTKLESRSPGKILGYELKMATRFPEENYRDRVVLIVPIGSAGMEEPPQIRAAREAVHDLEVQLSAAQREQDEGLTRSLALDLARAEAYLHELQLAQTAGLEQAPVAEQPEIGAGTGAVPPVQRPTELPGGGEIVPIGQRVPGLPTRPVSLGSSVLLASVRSGLEDLTAWRGQVTAALTMNRYVLRDDALSAAPALEALGLAYLAVVTKPAEAKALIEFGVKPEQILGVTDGKSIIPASYLQIDHQIHIANPADLSTLGGVGGWVSSYFGNENFTVVNTLEELWRAGFDQLPEAMRDVFKRATAGAEEYLGSMV